MGKYNVDHLRNPELKEVFQPILTDIEEQLYGVSTAAELATQLADASVDTIHLMADITITAQQTFDREITVYGNGHKITATALSAAWYMATQVTSEGVTFDDVHFHISGNSDGNALYSIDVGAARCTVNNCTFVMANAGASGSVSVYYEGYANQSLNRNTLSNGVAVTGGAVMAQFKNNTFAATKGVGLGVATIGTLAYTAASTAQLTLITDYLIGEGNVTTGFATTLNVESYL